MQESNCIDNSQEDGSDDEDLIMETEELRTKSLQQVVEAIAMIPLEERAALEEAREKAPELVASESDPLRFLRFHNFNSWAAARRLACYWKLRKEAFGDRFILPLDFSGNGGPTEEDVKIVHTGCLIILPKDESGRSVLCVDRSKMLEGDMMSPKVLFLCIQRLSENEESLKSGYVSIINLSNPFGAAFHKSNVQFSKDLVKKAMPLKVNSIHVVCCPPGQGRQSFVSTIVPLALKRLGSFWSKFVKVHVANSEEEACEQLKQHGFAREHLPAYLGGTWNGLDEWLVSEKSQIERNPKLEPLVRNTLWAYTESLNRTDPSPRSRPDSGISFSSTSEENALQDRITYAHFDIRDYTKHQQRDLPQEERAIILQDIYGSSDVGFTITREVEVEGRARKEFDEAIKLLKEEDVRDYLKAKEIAPHLIELESDPLRYLRIENFNIWEAVRRVALYWKTRKEVFGDLAFLPLTLSGESALSKEVLQLMKTGFMTIQPPDDTGRPILFHDLSRLTIPFTGENRVRFGFYMMNVLSELEASRNVGIIGVGDFSKTPPPGTADPKYARKTTEMVRDGVFPVHMRAWHICATGIKSNTLRDTYFVPFVLQLLRRWKSMSFRTVIHVDDTSQGLRASLVKYGIPPHAVPDSVGGTWTYENDLEEWIRDRTEYEKEAYGVIEGGSKGSAAAARKSPTSDPGKPADKMDKVQREKKRKMDALYARRKRERQRIEIEVLQEQCVEYNNKNDNLEKQNKWLEGRLQQAQSIVRLSKEGRFGTSNNNPNQAFAQQNLQGYGTTGIQAPRTGFPGYF